MAVKKQVIEKEELETKFFKLNDGRQVFWDPAQTDPNNRKLRSGEVKELEMTDQVQKARRGEFIIPAERADIEDYRQGQKEKLKAKATAQDA